MAETERATRTIDPAEPPVIAPGHNYASVTDQIGGMVLTR